MSQVCLFSNAIMFYSFVHFPGKETAHISAIFQNIPYKRTRYRGILRQAGQKDRLDIIFQAPVHISDRFLVFEIIYVTDAPQDKVGSNLLATFHRQSFIYHGFNFGIIFINIPQPLQPLLLAEHRHFIDIAPYANNKLVKQRQCRLIMSDARGSPGHMFRK